MPATISYLCAAVASVLLRRLIHASAQTQMPYGIMVNCGGGTIPVHEPRSD
jgi:hypothetical protein